MPGLPTSVAPDGRPALSGEVSRSLAVVAQIEGSGILTSGPRRKTRHGLPNCRCDCQLAAQLPYCISLSLHCGNRQCPFFSLGFQKYLQISYLLTDRRGGDLVDGCRSDEFPTDVAFVVVAGRCEVVHFLSGLFLRLVNRFVSKGIRRCAR